MQRMMFAALLAVWALSGCYTYVPSSVGEVMPEQRVRLRLSPGEATRLQEYLQAEGRTLSGVLVEDAGDSVLVRVPGRTELKGARVETLYQRIYVGKAGILDVDRRELDRGKTYLVSASAIVAAAALTIQQLRNPGGSDVVPGGGGPSDSVIPALVFRLPLSLLGILHR